MRYIKEEFVDNPFRLETDLGECVVTIAPVNQTFISYTFHCVGGYLLLSRKNINTLDIDMKTSIIQVEMERHENCG